MKIMFCDYGFGCSLALPGENKTIDCTSLNKREVENIIDKVWSVHNPWLYVKVSNYVYNQLLKN